MFPVLLPFDLNLVQLNRYCVWDPGPYVGWLFEYVSNYASEPGKQMTSGHYVTIVLLFIYGNDCAILVTSMGMKLMVFCRIISLWL